MSVVTDIIFICGIDDNMADVFLDNSGASFKKVDQYAGGKKAIQCDVYMSAMNYFETDKMLDVFKETNFEYNEQAQLMVKEEESFLFKVHIKELIC